MREDAEMDETEEEAPCAPASFPETQRERRGHSFYPSRTAISAIPGLYSESDAPIASRLVHIHYFLGGLEWWITDYDHRDGTAFGYANLADPLNAEWGYVHLPELEAINVGPIGQVVERDLLWTPRPAGECGLPGRWNPDRRASGDR